MRKMRQHRGKSGSRWAHSISSASVVIVNAGAGGVNEGGNGLVPKGKRQANWFDVHFVAEKKDALCHVSAWLTRAHRAGLVGRPNMERVRDIDRGKSAKGRRREFGDALSPTLLLPADLSCR
jgi:hypothetical protein